MEQENDTTKEQVEADLEKNVAPKNTEFLRESFATEQECLVFEVQERNKPGLADKVRITIGTIEENDALLAGIKKL